MKDKRLHRSRKWLGKTGHSFVETVVTRTTWVHNKKPYTSVDSNVTLGDCSRQVTFDFYIDSKKDAKEQLARLDLLIHELQAVYITIEHECKEQGFV